MPDWYRLDLPGLFSSGSSRRFGGSLHGEETGGWGWACCWVLGAPLGLELGSPSGSLGCGGPTLACASWLDFCTVRLVATAVAPFSRVLGSRPTTSPLVFSPLCSSRRSLLGPFFALLWGVWCREMGVRSLSFGHTAEGSGWRVNLDSLVMLLFSRSSLMGREGSLTSSLLWLLSAGSTKLLWPFSVRVYSSGTSKQ